MIRERAAEIIRARVAALLAENERDVHWLAQKATIDYYRLHRLMKGRQIDWHVIEVKNICDVFGVPIDAVLAPMESVA